MAAAMPAPLSADLEHGLRRLKLASMRRVAPEMLATAKTQRWAPEELLRALVEVEITARDASNTVLRSKQACFPTVKTVEQFDLAASSIGTPTWAYLTSLEWISARENLTLIGPAGTGKSHTLIALGHAAVEAWPRPGRRLRSNHALCRQDVRCWLYCADAARTRRPLRHLLQRHVRAGASVAGKARQRRIGTWRTYV